MLQRRTFEHHAYSGWSTMLQGQQQTLTACDYQTEQISQCNFTGFYSYNVLHKLYVVHHAVHCIYAIVLQIYNTR